MTIRIAVLVPAMLGAAFSMADTRFVDAAAPAGGDGLSWNTAYRQLQDALFEAGGDPRIVEARIAGGIYRPDHDEAGNVVLGDRTASFQMINGLALRGGYAGSANPAEPNRRDIALYETTLSGDLLGDDGPSFQNNDENSHHILTAHDTDPTAVLDGFTVKGGNANGPCCEANKGAGLYLYYGSPTVRDCVFAGNAADGEGAGIFISNSDLTITNTTFSGNAAGGPGGGGLHTSVGAPTLTDCTFTNNSADNGGALYIGSGPARLTSCTFDGNSATGEGGAARVTGSEGQMINCRFVNNVAGNGGGALACAFGGSPSLSNCLFARNTSGFGGGAILVARSSDIILINCTITANTVNGSGAALYFSSSAPYLSNCIVYGNTPQPEPIYGAGPAYVYYSCIEGGYAGVANIDTDPRFADRGHDDFHLAGDSPCIDAANNPAVLPGVVIDLDGNPRFVDDPLTPNTGDPPTGEPLVDMGAYEFQLACRADLSGDGRVDLADLGILLTDFGCNGGGCAGDIDGDGDTDLADLGLLLSAFGEFCP